MLKRDGLGTLMYGLSAVLLGVIGLIWHDFAAVWQPIDNVIGFNRTVVASVYAFAFLAAGIATMIPRAARFGLPVLVVLHLLAALGWIPRVIGHAAWNGFFEMLSLTIAGVVAYARLGTLSYTAAAPMIAIGRIVFAVCLLSFGISHFSSSAETAGMVPAWLPPGKMFWAWATGAFYLLASLALLIQRHAVLAARLVIVMMLSFILLVWLPMLLDKPIHFMWAGNAITFAMATAAWVIADSVADRRAASSRVP
jgi:uncharacterized membrane protein